MEGYVNAGGALKSKQFACYFNAANQPASFLARMQYFAVEVRLTHNANGKM